MRRAVAGAFVLLVVASMVLTRATAEQSASVLHQGDSALMDMSRVGPAPRFRDAYDLADGIVASVEATDSDGNVRELGLATAIGAEQLLMPPEHSVGGYSVRDPPPERFSDLLGTTRTDAYRAYLEASRYTVFAMSSLALETAFGDIVELLYRDRRLPVRYLDQDPELGIALLVAQLDDGHDDEDDDYDGDEIPPLSRFINVDLSGQSDTSRTFVILRGDTSVHEATNGFQMVPARYGVDDSVVEVEAQVTEADLGGPAVVGFEEGADPQVVGMMAHLTDGGWAQLLQTRELIDFTLRAAEADADITSTTPFAGIVGHTGDDGSGTASPVLGFVIDEIDPDRGAAGSGLRVGDRIVAVDDAEVRLETDFRLAVRTHAIADVVTLTVVRGEATLTFDITLSAP